MKKTLFILLSFLLTTISCLSQETKEPESSKPSFDTEIVRKCASLDIEGEIYDDVVVTIKSINPDYFISDKFRVKVLVENEKGKKVYKKTFNNAYLYIYSKGQIQVGKPKFNQLVISRGEIYKDTWFGIIREKEGVW